MRLLAILLGLAIVAYAGAVFTINRHAAPTAGAIEITGGAGVRAAGERLDMISWNLGYGGLGAESDFVADGGSRILAPDRAAVARNVDGIVRTLSQARADVVMLQEVAVTSPLNYWRALWSEVRQSRPASGTAFLVDVVSRGLPWPVRLEHGLATLSEVRIGTAQSVPLPLENSYWLGMMRKQYALLVTRLPIAGGRREWVLANLHLAAFDEGGATRRRQLDAVIAFAQQEFARGNPVVIGGDWNMVLGGRERPHKTEARHLDWVRPLPSGAVPAGWQFVLDPERPTVRTLHKPYVAGENFVTTIDGFLVSPNVGVEGVQVIDQGFAFSDHHPVVATFVAN